MKAYKAYDIRGIYNKDFDRNDVYRIGYFLPRLLNTNKVLIGRDVRVSSDEIYEYLCKGITDSGADVYNIGHATTPMVYWSTNEYNFEASVMITASHNPREYNGLKVSRKNALPVGFDSGLSDLKTLTETHSVIPVEKKGSIINYHIKEHYIKFLKQYIGNYNNLTIAVDCSNGMAALLIKDLLKDQPHYLYDELDGTFPNHEANPLIEENVADLKKLVISKHADVGIIYDGDADRVMFVDEKGNFISPDLMIGVLAHHYGQGQGNVLQDIRTSKAVGEYIHRFGYTMNMWRVGRAYAALKLREIDGLFGGELAGHYYFKEFSYSDSGIMASLIILDVIAKMKEQGITLSSLIEDIRGGYHNSGELNFRIEDKAGAMEAVKSHFEQTEHPTAIYDFDGYRLEFEDWWFNIRPSNTEPYLRFLAEAKSSDTLHQKVTVTKMILEQFK